MFVKIEQYGLSEIPSHICVSDLASITISSLLTTRRKSDTTAVCDWVRKTACANNQVVLSRLQAFIATCKTVTHEFITALWSPVRVGISPVAHWLLTAHEAAHKTVFLSSNPKHFIIHSLYKGSNQMNNIQYFYCAHPHPIGILNTLPLMLY